jgi:DNA-binding transcriptional LysR family regulator
VELRHLRYFVAVAEELHFGHAATRLHISQPPLSQQIHDLERELGVELLHRNRRSVSLTEAGRLFLGEARQVLGNAEHAVEIVKRASRGEIGRLSIGFGPTPENGILKDVLSLFVARHPDVDLELHSLYTQEQVEALEHETIDVGFPLLPIANRDLITERIGVERVVTALPSHHRLASRSRIALADLRDEPFILISRDVGGFYGVIVEACQRAGFTPVVKHEVRHILTLLGCVAAGLGVTLLPDAVAGASPPGVLFRPILPRTPTVEIGVAYRRNGGSPALAAFVEVIREVAGHQRTRLACASGGRTRAESPRPFFVRR